MSDFFDTHTGNAPPLVKGHVWKRWVRDALLDVDLRMGRGLARVRARDAPSPTKVLIVGIEVPSRAADIHAVTRRLVAGSRHDVTVSIAPMADRGKFANIDAAIARSPRPLAGHDWLVVTDDDIAFAPRLLDDLIALATLADLDIAQPAHAYRSHTTYAITRRLRGSLVRLTRFVEIGPLTLIRRSAFDALIPFPPSRWCYGIDVLWSEIAERNGFRMGIVDGTPVRHLRPVAVSYDMDEARAEGRQLLERFGVDRNRDELFAGSDVVVPATWSP